MLFTLIANKPGRADDGFPRFSPNFYSRTDLTIEELEDRLVDLLSEKLQHCEPIWQCVVSAPIFELGICSYSFYDADIQFQTTGDELKDNRQHLEAFYLFQPLHKRVAGRLAAITNSSNDSGS